MPHAYTAVMNGRDIYRFLDILKDLIDTQIFITIDPLEQITSPAAVTMKKLFADAPKIKISKKIRIDSLMENMNNAQF